MRCLACGAEMRLEEEVRDETVAVSGFKRHTFKCSVCGDVEQRLTFSREVEPSPADAVSLHSEAPLPPETPLHSEAPLVSPPSAAEHEEAAAPNVTKNVCSKFARISRAAVRRLSRGMTFRSALPNVATPPTSASLCEPVSDPNLPPTSPAPAEPESARAIVPAPVLRETDTDIEECENLLRRAINLVHVPTRSSPQSESATQGILPAVGSAAPAITSSLLEPGLAASALATSSSEADPELVESAAPAIAASVPEPEPDAPATATGLSKTEPASLTIASSFSELGPAAPAIGTSHPETARAPAVASAISEPGLAAPALPASHSEAEPVAAAGASSLPEPRSAAPAIAASVPQRAAPAAATRPSDVEPTARATATSLLEAVSATPPIATSTSAAEPGAPATSASPPKPESETPAELAQFPRAERSPASRVVVQIQYDPVKAKYVATDIKTGFRILRHQDSTRLREICDRMNLQVVEGAVASEGYWSQVSRKSQGSSQMPKNSSQSARINIVHHLRRKP
jgi:hypothetical protein